MGNGGIIGVNNAPSSPSGGSGVWSMQGVYKAVVGGNWSN